MRKHIALALLCGLLFTGHAAIAKHNKCALIAGGSKGIGYAIAEALAKRGWDLVLVAATCPIWKRQKRNWKKATAFTWTSCRKT